MDQKIIPLKIDGITENIYGGFELRLGSILLDFIIFFPFLVLMHYLHSFGKNYQIVTSVSFLIIGLWYGIYLPKKYGGTPGKLLLGLKIIKINGDVIGWKESILRNLISTIISVFGILVTIYCVLQANNELYLSKSWIQKGVYITGFAPKLISISSWANNIWTYSELIVLLSNQRKRAIHDFIAGTVIVKSKYIGEINNVLTDNTLN